MNGEIILNSSLVFAVFLIIISVLYSITSARQLAKRKKELEKLHQDLQVGKEVMFSAGLTGKITSLDQEFAQIQLDKTLSIKVSRYAITEIL